MLPEVCDVSNDGTKSLGEERRRTLLAPTSCHQWMGPLSLWSTRSKLMPFGAMGGDESWTSFSSEMVCWLPTIDHYQWFRLMVDSFCHDSGSSLSSSFSSPLPQTVSTHYRRRTRWDLLRFARVYLLHMLSSLTSRHFFFLL